MENESVYPLPLRTNKTEHAPRAGFAFLLVNGDKKEPLKHVTYKPAKFYDGKKSFFYFSYKHEGKFHRFKIYGDVNRIKDPDERKEYIKNGISEINRRLQSGFNPFEQEPMTVAVKNWTLIQGINYFKQNLGNRGLRERSVKLYGSVLKWVYKYFAPIYHEDIKKITRNHIQAVFRKAQSDKKLANSTYNNYITFLRTIFNFLKDEGIIDENPVKIKRLPEVFKRHKYFSPEEFEKIKKNAEPELLRFMMFLYHTGLRPSEAMRMNYENINRINKTLFVPAAISKNRKDASVPIGDYILDNYKGTGKIFTVAERHYTKKFSKLKRKLKLDKENTLYAVKHTAAITMAKNGVAPYAMMQFFRHSNLNTTMSYLRGLDLDLSWIAADALKN